MSRLRRRKTARQQAARFTAPTARSRPNRCTALLVIDNAPLQAAAWAELQRARRRLEKASTEIHRHDERDEPAFRAWLTATFPRLLSRARDLAQQVDAKGRLVEAVESEAFFTGRSPAAVWRAMQEPRDPAAAGREHTESADSPRDAFDPEPGADAIDEELRQMFEREGIADDDPMADVFREMARTLRRDRAAGKSGGPDAAEARAIYRRLVQHLHPDRGGDWTPARARAWEQVQQAWQAGDADWLSRLEAEWEARTDSLGPASALGRLRAACREIDAARRDADRRVRSYRQLPSWRFSSLGPRLAQLHTTTERQLRHDVEMMALQLEDLEAAIARWQRPQSRGRRRKPRASREPDELPWF